MSLVVSDTLPLNLLVQVGVPAVLPALFHQVVVPPEAAAELAHPKAPPAALARGPAAVLPLPHLDPGEAAVVGAIGVLERAADAGLVPDLAAVHARVRGLRSHVADAVRQASLARHLARKAGPAGGPCPARSMPVRNPDGCRATAACPVGPPGGGPTAPPPPPGQPRLEAHSGPPRATSQGRAMPASQI